MFITFLREQQKALEGCISNHRHQAWQETGGQRAEVEKIFSFLFFLYLYIISLVSQCICHFITFKSDLIQKITKRKREQGVCCAPGDRRVWIRTHTVHFGVKLESAQQGRVIESDVPLFTVARKQPKCPLTDKGQRRCGVYIYILWNNIQLSKRMK